jgi:GTP pyrophosphokinase
MLRQYELVERVLAYAPQADEAMLNRAYVYTVQKHGTQKRASGDPYFSHPVEVAGLMTELKLDQETIVTALLHDTVEDTLATVDEIERLFGADVARLVDGVTKLSKIETMTESERAAENLRKFLLAMSEDLRVLLVKLADRLHNMRTLHFIKSEDKRRRIARETMEIYAPLAQRVGMYEYMREMQLLAFEQLGPKPMPRSPGAWPRSAARAAARWATLPCRSSRRWPKPGCAWKWRGARSTLFHLEEDGRAPRLVRADHRYHGVPRAGGRRGRMLQGAGGAAPDVADDPGAVQGLYLHAQDQRLQEPAHLADLQQCAPRGSADQDARDAPPQRIRPRRALGLQAGGEPDGEVGWLRDLVEILDASHDAEELLENTKMAIYQDRIFAFTPKGALFQLPKGATPIDFAFAVHTNLGAQAVGAKINGRHVPLRTPLGNGDVVEIIKSRNSEPQLSWLGFAVTGKARAAIRRAVRQKERAEVALIGRKLYEEIAERLATPVGKKALADAVKRLKLNSEEDLMVAIGTAKLDDRQVMEALVPGSTANLPNPEDWPRQQRAIAVRGLTPGMAFKLADCCHPVPGDRIVGLRRPGKGVEVHAIDCEKLADGVDADWIDLSWDKRTDGAVGRIRAELYNRPGTLAEMAGIFAKNHANVVNLEMTQRENPFHTYLVDLEVRDLAHLTRIISALRASDAVAQADRI